jgi:hypothetical protein
MEGGCRVVGEGKELMSEASAGDDVGSDICDVSVVRDPSAETGEAKRGTRSKS